MEVDGLIVRVAGGLNPRYALVLDAGVICLGSMSDPMTDSSGKFDRQNAPIKRIPFGDEDDGIPLKFHPAPLQLLDQSSEELIVRSDAVLELNPGLPQNPAEFLAARIG